MPSYSGGNYLEAEIRRITVQGRLRQTVLETLTRKCPTQKRAGGVTQVVECLTIASVRALVQTPVPPKKNQSEKVKSTWNLTHKAK
jgi:hypothetical protein